MKVNKVNTALIVILLIFCAFKWQKKITVHSIGDSTMCIFDESYLNRFGGPDYPIRGWMQMMPELVKKDLIINNAAKSGRSSKSFRSEGLWDKVKEKIKPGDYVFIQFGHNDANKKDSLRLTDPQTTFKENIRDYVNEVRAKNANPILFTSITRRTFDKNGKVTDTHGEYVTVVRELATEMNVPLVDLNKMTAELVQSLGPEESKKLYVHIQPGVFSKLPEGKKDDTHLSKEGATEVAKLAIKGLKEIKSPLVEYIVH